MKFALSLFIICYLTLSVNSQVQYFSKIGYNIGHTIYKGQIFDLICSRQDSIKIKEKSPFLAASLSFIVPGLALGQFYNGEYLHGAIRVGISALSIIWFLESSSTQVGGGGSADQKLIALLIYSFNWITSIIHASISASQINKKNKEIDKDRRFNLKFMHQRLNFSIRF